MANALSWIVKEAKKLRRQYPHRYDSLQNPWRDGYIAQASAIYASKHKGRSPVGKKKHKPHKKKKVGVAYKGRVRPAARRDTGGPSDVQYIHRTPQMRGGRSVRGIQTKSRSHTDKNRITANIQVGSYRPQKRLLKYKVTWKPQGKRKNESQLFWDKELAYEFKKRLEMKGRKVRLSEGHYGETVF